MINVIFARMETQAEEEIVRLDGEHQQEGSVIANGETEAKQIRGAIGRGSQFGEW
ncbi:uncharacterized protein LOC143897951 isoform X2 [Temnothorax americanus]|uniref:uncharacterized protein LOC143897951 isoform X2 n=1 Tax=Temnothorax americanus TaxID=1964332 RepID=UPI00406808AC